MPMTMKDGIETYQCPGCVVGSDTSCGEYRDEGNGCKAHCPGTILGSGFVFLGLPKGFCRVGHVDMKVKAKVRVFETFEKAKEVFGYDRFNVPVWAHLDKRGNTIVRLFQPRLAYSEIHVILEDCMDRLKAVHVITAEELEDMD